MILKNDEYEINIVTDENYEVNSADSAKYDVVLNPQGLTGDDLYTVFAITVGSKCKGLHVALVGNVFSSDDDACALLNGGVLIVLQNRDISLIDCATGELIGRKYIDSAGVNFGIYRVENGYIIYGEREILMFDPEFNKKWSFAGKDILVSVTHDTSFELGADFMELYDYQDNYYKVDFEGNLLESRGKA